MQLSLVYPLVTRHSTLRELWFVKIKSVSENFYLNLRHADTFAFSLFLHLKKRCQQRSLVQRCLLIMIDPDVHTKSQSSRSNIFNASATFFATRIANHPIYYRIMNLFITYCNWK